MNPFQLYNIFDGMRIPHLSLLIKCAAEKICQPGELLFCEGDPVMNLFLIKTGAVALHPEPVTKTRAVKIVRSGGFLGLSCLVPRAAWRLSGQVLGVTTITILDGARLSAAANENSEFARELSRRAAQLQSEFSEYEGPLLKIHIEAIAARSLPADLETITGNSESFSNNALELSPHAAKHLCLHDGQWVQLADAQGSAIVPVHVHGARRNQNPMPIDDGKVQSQAR